MPMTRKSAVDPIYTIAQLLSYLQIEGTWMELKFHIGRRAGPQSKSSCSRLEWWAMDAGSNKPRCSTVQRRLRTSGSENTLGETRWYRQKT